MAREAGLEKNKEAIHGENIGILERVMASISNAYFRPFSHDETPFFPMFKFVILLFC